MSVSMSSRDQPELTGGLECRLSDLLLTPAEELAEVYETDRSVQWIQSGGFSRVSLQFPDYLLHQAPAVTAVLKERLGDTVSLFILGDTTYGECCVDEIAAEHVKSEAVVHYGHSCLTPPNRTPTLWVFTRRHCPVSLLVQAVQEKLSADHRKVILLYDVEYEHLLSDLHIPNIDLVIGRCSGGAQSDGVQKFGRTFTVDDISELTDSVVVYVGKGDQGLLNFIYNWPDNEFFVFDEGNLVPAEVPVARHMMKRYFLVEKAKDAERVGLLVGTLGTEKYLDILEKLKTSGKNAGKRIYTFLVGKPNVAKLANFPEVDVFVLVACPETTLIDSKEFLQPIITPFEFSLACNTTIQWSGRLITDYRDLLGEQGGLLPAKEEEVSCEDSEDGEGDVSLITGKVRTSYKASDLHSEGQLTVINDKTIRFVD